MKDVIIIAGPTAVGKSDLAINLAKKLDTEIISADSMQIYKYMDIGTAKVSKQEMQLVKHHLIDIVEPSENFSVQEFKKLALDLIENLHLNGKIPIVVGGTGLFIDSLTHNFDFNEVAPDEDYRLLLEKEYEANPQKLLDRVLSIANGYYTNINLKDKKKIIRILEVFDKSGKLIDYTRKPRPIYKYHLYVLNDNREDLYDRINKRVDLMIENGLVEEVQNLLLSVPKSSQSIKAIGYREVISYLDGELTYDEMVDKLKQNSRHYAKRQITWFKRNEFSQWINISEYSKEEIINLIVSNL